MILKVNSIEMTPQKKREMEVKIQHFNKFVEACQEKVRQQKELEERVPKKNPYANLGKTLKVLKREKVRRTLAKKTQPNGNPWTWSMGYNNLVGRFTGTTEYPRLSGSSWNRSLKLKFQTSEQRLQAATDHLFKVAGKVHRKLHERHGRKIPGAYAAFLREPTEQGARKFRDWFSSAVPGSLISDSLPLHVLSPRSRGKIKDKITAFWRASSGDRVFATLTFIEPVSDRTGVAILNKFLTSLRKDHKNLQFVWVAERQENGNIHFHMLLNKRLPVRRYNALWVLQQYNEGLRGKTKFGDEISLEEIQSLYKSGKVGKVLNPLDVRKVRSIHALSGYLTKYVTKQKNGELFGCLTWHCSRTVSRLFTRAVVSPSAFSYMKSLANIRQVDKDTGEVFMPREKTGPFHTLIYSYNKRAPLKYLIEMEAVNKFILQGMLLTEIPTITDCLYRSRFCNTTT